MPITKTYTLYTFDELSDKAKAKARDWFRLGDYADDRLPDSFAQTLNYYGFPEGTMKIYYSLSYCQGDGVAFEGRIDFDALLATTESELVSARTDAKLVEVRDLITQARALGMELEGSVVHFGRYSHEYSMNVELDYRFEGDSENEPTAEMNAVFAKLATKLEGLVYNLSLELKSDGYAEIEYQHSDEVVDEGILANEYTFEEDGTRMN